MGDKDHNSKETVSISDAVNNIAKVSSNTAMGARRAASGLYRTRFSKRKLIFVLSVVVIGIVCFLVAATSLPRLKSENGQSVRFSLAVYTLARICGQANENLKSANRPQIVLPNTVDSIMLRSEMEEVSGFHIWWNDQRKALAAEAEKQAAALTIEDSQKWVGGPCANDDAALKFVSDLDQRSYRLFIE